MLIPLAPTRTLASGVRDTPTSPPAPSIETLATTPNRGLKMPSPFIGGAAAGGDASSSQVSAKEAVATVSENRNTNKSLYDTKHSPAFLGKPSVEGRVNGLSVRAKGPANDGRAGTSGLVRCGIRRLRGKA